MKTYTRTGCGYTTGDRVQDQHPKRVALNGRRRGTVLDVWWDQNEFGERLIQGVRVEWDDQPQPVCVRLGTVRKLGVVEQIGEIPVQEA